MLWVGKKKHFGRPTVLSQERQHDLTTHVLDLEQMLLGVSKTIVLEVAFQIASKNNAPLRHIFNDEKKSAGNKWFLKFMRRNPQLSLRNPEGTSIARAAEFNKKSVYRFYDILESVLDKYKFDAQSIYTTANRKKEVPVKKRLTISKKEMPVKKGQATNRKPKNSSSGAMKESWFCFLCCETVDEAVTQCIGCSRWVHNKCADETRLFYYVCDVCK